MPISPPGSNFPWSPDANYPAGTDPWSGNPTKVDPVDSKFTPKTGLPATYLNKLLRDRDLVLEQLIAQANATEGNIVPASGGHEWTNTSGGYVVAEQLGLKDTVTGLTPFASGVVAGDVIIIDFAAMVGAYSNEVGNYYSWNLKLVVSETATDFVTGTWANIEADGNVSVRTLAGTAANTTPDVVCVNWACKYIAAGTTGHVRFAIQANRSGADEDLTFFDSSGRYRWMHLG